MENIVLMRNQEAVAYYVREMGYGFTYGVLVKISYLNEIKYGFITTSGQVSKEYKTKKGMAKWVGEREWQQITTDLHKSNCLEIVKKIGE